MQLQGAEPSRSKAAKDSMKARRRSHCRPQRERQQTGEVVVFLVKKQGVPSASGQVTAVGFSERPAMGNTGD